MSWRSTLASAPARSQSGRESGQSWRVEQPVRRTWAQRYSRRRTSGGSGGRGRRRRGRASENRSDRRGSVKWVRCVKIGENGLGMSARVNNDASVGRQRVAMFAT
eukprot:39447-Pleurochrysis_carterae.AAC.1